MAPKAKRNNNTRGKGGQQKTASEKDGKQQNAASGKDLPDPTWQNKDATGGKYRKIFLFIAIFFI